MKHALAIVLTVTSFAHVQAQAEVPKGKVDEAQAEVKKLQQDFVAAFSKSSKALAAYFEPLLSAEAVITDHAGRVYDKVKFLDMAKAGDRGPLAMEERDLKANVYGDTVVATGLVAAKGLPQEAFRFTTVYVKRRTQWQIVAMQLTAAGRP
jgi:ketosteroid isomerase-like protein